MQPAGLQQNPLTLKVAETQLCECLNVVRELLLREPGPVKSPLILLVAGPAPYHCQLLE